MAPYRDLLDEKKTIKFNDWLLELGPKLTGATAQKIQVFIRLYCSCFVFKLEDLEGYRRKYIHIQLEDDHPIFRCLYRLGVLKKDGVQTCYKELLAADLIKLLNGEYAFVIVMPSKKNVFSN